MTLPTQSQAINAEPAQAEGSRAGSSETGSVPPPSVQPSSKKLQLLVSDKAVVAIREQLKKRGTPAASLRVGVRGGGCSGFSYVIEFYDGEPRTRDIVYQFDDVRVLVDPKSLLYLNGATLEWEKTLLRQGFKFVNPNEKSNCGCGTSFQV